MASPLAKGLFQRVIGESGANFGRGTKLEDMEKKRRTLGNAGGPASQIRRGRFENRRIVPCRAWTAGSSRKGVSDIFAQRQTERLCR